MKQLMKRTNFTGNIIKKTLIYLARSLQNLNIPRDFILLLSPARLLRPALPKIYGVCHFEDQCLDYQLYMYFVPKVQGFLLQPTLVPLVIPSPSKPVETFLFQLTVGK